MPEQPPSPPPYIRFDKKQRDELLSQCGVTASPQREMFHQLCNTWRPLIDFDSFTGARAGVVQHPAQETENLVTKLRSARMAIFTYKRNEKGERVPKDIILCEEASPRYWFFFIQDLVQQACENPRNPFLTLAILKSREVPLPSGEIEELAINKLSKGGIEALAKTEKLLLLPLLGENVLASSQSLSLLLGFSSAKLRFILKNTEVTAAVSRLLNLGLTDVTKRLEDKESGFWRGLTETLLTHREDLLADRRLHLDVGFFQAAELFFQYLTNQLEEAKRQKELDQERESDLRQVEQLVLQDKDVLMPPEELESHFKLLFKDKYGEGFEALRQEFQTTYLENAQKTALAPILTLRSGLVHRNNLYRFFLKRFESLSGLLVQEYQIKMDRRVRRADKSGELDFLNRENLERSLREWSAKSDPLVGELLDKPKILAEALIHFARTSQGLSSVEDMKPLMERFFKPGVMSFKPLLDIFALDVQSLYENAFRRLSVIVQFWRRMTGAYRIQGDELRVLAPPREKKSDPSRPLLSGLKVNETPLEKLSPEELKERKKEWARRRLNQPVTSKPKISAEEFKKQLPKEYSDGERNKAWQGFRETLGKDDE